MLCKVCGVRTKYRRLLCDTCREPEPGKIRCTDCLKVKDISCYTMSRGKPRPYCRACARARKKRVKQRKSEPIMPVELQGRYMRVLALAVLKMAKIDYQKEGGKIYENVRRFIEDVEFVREWCILADIDTKRYLNAVVNTS